MPTLSMATCLVFHTVQVVEKDLLIQEKEKLYMELKNILSRQPGPEVAEQLSIYQVSSCGRCCSPHVSVVRQTNKAREIELIGALTQVAMQLPRLACAEATEEGKWAACRACWHRAFLQCRL